MTASTKPLLSDEVRKALASAGLEIGRGFLRPDTLELVLARLDRMTAADAVRADRQLALAIRQYIEPALDARRTPLFALFGKRPFDLSAAPGAEHLLVFHLSGYVREDALRRFSGGLRSPFFFGAVAHRLNDWVPQVRRAARSCAERTFPLTPPQTIAEAAIDLLDRSRSWRRWGDEAGPLDAAFARPDVLACLVERLREGRTGPLGSVLRGVLRGCDLDGHLAELATGAVQPAVRAAAIRALIEGMATWPVGYRKQWISKPEGKFRRVPVHEQRALATDLPREDFVRLAAADRSAAVRRIAAEALIRHGESLAGMNEVTRQLAKDRSPSIRERIAFLNKGAA